MSGSEDLAHSARYEAGRPAKASASRMTRHPFDRPAVAGKAKSQT
jgi:hypothetical protein